MIDQRLPEPSGTHEIGIAAADRSQTGREFLEQRSRSIKQLQGLPPIEDVLIVEDRTSDADLLASALHIVIGRKTNVRFAKTEHAIAPAIKERLPDLVFLDDRIGRVTRAEHNVPTIRKAGYNGPIIMVAEVVTRQRWMELARLNVADVIHKDDLVSTRVREAILRVFTPTLPDGAPPDSSS